MNLYLSGVFWNITLVSYINIKNFQTYLQDVEYFK